jgi:hypothetical protein
MYTQDGTEVMVVKKIEDGYLAKIIYYTGIDEDDYDDEIEDVCEQVVFYEKLYENPPTEKLSKEVKELKSEIESLSSKISELKQLKNTEEYLLNKISKYPIIKQLADYLTGNFNFVLFIRTMEVKKKSSVYISSFIRTSNSKNETYALYELKNEYYISDSDDKPFMVFETEEELLIEAKRRLIEKFKNAEFNYNKVSNLKQWFDAISSTCSVKKDEDFLNVYESKLKVWEAEENKERQEKLKKELEELEKKKNELKKLQES